ncbi:MAG: hypothetical protein IH828_02060 [Nitrospinae bacterium]|nr:hypothetical protein [Nitrospinota bacterium]
MRQLVLVWGLLVALATLPLACRAIPKLARVPKTPDIVIKADEAYLEGEEAERDLSKKYYQPLEEIIAEVREVFPIQDFEFFERQVGFFPAPKAEQGSYLGIGAFTDKTFDTVVTNRNKRVATIFAMYGKPLLEIMAAKEQPMGDPSLQGLKLYITYWKKDATRQPYAKGETEWVEFFFKKRDVLEYLDRRITDQELLDNNYVFMESGKVKILMGEAL